MCVVTDLGYKHWDLLFKISSLSACNCEILILMRCQLPSAAKSSKACYYYVDTLLVHNKR